MNSESSKGVYLIWAGIQKILITPLTGNLWYNMAIDEDYQTTFEKVDTYDGESQPIQIWAKDQDSYSGIGTDKLGIWGTIVGVDFDLCVADGACIDACPVEVFEWIDTPNSTASDKKAIMIREDECIICRACESVCPVEAVLITED